MRLAIVWPRAASAHHPPENAKQQATLIVGRWAQATTCSSVAGKRHRVATMRPRNPACPSLPMQVEAIMSSPAASHRPRSIDAWVLATSPISRRGTSGHFGPRRHMPTSGIAETNATGRGRSSTLAASPRKAIRPLVHWCCQPSGDGTPPQATTATESTTGGLEDMLRASGVDTSSLATHRKQARVLCHGANLRHASSPGSLSLGNRHPPPGSQPAASDGTRGLRGRPRCRGGATPR